MGGVVNYCDVCFHGEALPGDDLCADCRRHADYWASLTPEEMADEQQSIAEYCAGGDHA